MARNKGSGRPRIENAKTSLVSFRISQADKEKIDTLTADEKREALLYAVNKGSSHWIGLSGSQGGNDEVEQD